MSKGKKVIASRPTKGKRYDAQERETLASQIDTCVKTDVGNAKNIAEAVKDMDVLSLIGPDETNPNKLFGYKPSQIRHTADTYRAVRCSMKLSILEHSGKYERTRELLEEVVKFFNTSGKKNPCSQMLVAKTEGNVIKQELHDNATEGFVEVWNRSSNLQITLAELKKDYGDLQKHADTKIGRWAELVAKRTTILEDQDVHTTLQGQPVTLTGQRVETYADPICRAYFEAIEADKVKEAERRRKLTDKQKGLDSIKSEIEKIDTIIDQLDGGKPAIGKWTDDSSIAICDAWRGVKFALQIVEESMKEGKTVTAAQMKKSK
mgnify:CR=1 FL=1|tara:strand:+ start:7680 stop:8639 length:960 start_codon:yes stop_codon:yes gene_type:complete